jgi:hypothetical protein
MIADSFRTIACRGGKTSVQRIPWAAFVASALLLIVAAGCDDPPAEKLAIGQDRPPLDKDSPDVVLAWYDTLGFPDPVKCKFIKVATGH